MRVLKLKQTTQDGKSKLWKVDSKTPLVTFGAARKANLISLDTDTQKFHSALVHREDGWHYISFDLKDSNPDLKITKETTIHLNQSTLQFDVLEKDETLVNDFENLRTIGKDQKQIYIVQKNNRVLETAIVDLGQTYTYSIQGKKHKFKIAATSDWVHQEIEGFLIKSKLIGVDSMKHLSQMPKNQVLDAQSAKTLAVTLGITALFVFLSFLTPKKENLPHPQFKKQLNLNKPKPLNRKQSRLLLQPLRRAETKWLLYLKGLSERVFLS